MNHTSVAYCLLDAVRLERLALERANALHAREHAPVFNLVELLSPGETSLSAVFRWMLDETESHGQGDTYRTMFFKEFFEKSRHADIVSDVDWRGATTRCEVPTRKGRRVDVLVETADSRHAIVIENKPWAAWQERQLYDYWIEQNCHNDKTRAKVVAFVGRVPDAQKHIEDVWQRARECDPKVEHDFCHETLVGIGFKDVAEWIDRCADVSRPPKVAIFLRDLADYVRKRVSFEGLSMTDADNLAAEIVNYTPEHLRAARDVVAAMPAVYRELTRSLCARDSNYTYETGQGHMLWVERDGVSLAFCLFGNVRPWAGIKKDDGANSGGSTTDDRLSGSVAWKATHPNWPKWVFLSDAGGKAPALGAAASELDLNRVRLLLPDVINELLEPCPSVADAATSPVGLSSS